MSSPCGFPFCQPKQKIEQFCPRHPSISLSHFCASHSCLEMLCTQCLKQHQEAHQQHHTPERICKLVDIEQYYERITAKELEYDEQCKKMEKAKNERIDPCEILCQFVDQYFYGSTENKISNLKARKVALQKPSTKAFIDIVERSSHYKIQDNFKQKYFAFLDSVLGQAMK